MNGLPRSAIRSATGSTIDVEDGEIVLGGHGEYEALSMSPASPATRWPSSSSIWDRAILIKTSSSTSKTESERFMSKDVLRGNLARSVLEV